MSTYAPFGLLVSALAEYQTVTSSFVAVELVTRRFWSLAVMPAHKVELDDTFVSVEYDASKPLVTPVILAVGKANPHVLFARAVGEAIVPECGAIVLAPLTRLSVASASFSANV